MEKYKNINKRIILLFTSILIIFFEPQIFKAESFMGVQYFDNIYKGLKIIGFFIVLCLYLKINNLKTTKNLILISILQFVMLISTIIYKGDIVRFIGPAITVLTMTMIAEILVKKNILFETLKKINNYFVICFLLNIISVILIDFTSVSKYINVYFMGIDNRFIFTLLPWILFEGLVSLHTTNKLNLRWKIVFVVSELLLLYKFSVSAMICIAIYAIMLVRFLRNKNMLKYSNTIFIIYILFNILIITGKLQDIFAPFIQILGKDAATLSGRTYLWDGVLEQFRNYPLLGCGMKSIEYDKLFFYNSTAPYYLEFCKVSHAHNSIMTILYRGGIIAISIYLWIIFRTLKQLKYNSKSKYSNILLISLVIILITSIFDTMDFAALYFIITLIINIKKIDEKEGNCNENINNNTNL